MQPTPRLDRIAHRVFQWVGKRLATRAAERGDVHAANHLLLSLVVDGRDHDGCSLESRLLTADDIKAAVRGASPHSS